MFNFFLFSGYLLRYLFFCDNALNLIFDGSNIRARAKYISRRFSQPFLTCAPPTDDSPVDCIFPKTTKGYKKLKKRIMAIEEMFFSGASRYASFHFIGTKLNRHFAILCITLFMR